MNKEHNIMATSIIKALQEEKAVTSFARLMELLKKDFNSNNELNKYTSNQKDWAFENVLTMLQNDYALLRIKGQRASADRSFELTAKGYSVGLSPDFNGYLYKREFTKYLFKGVPLISSAVALIISCKSLIENNLNWPVHIYIFISLLLGIVIGYELKQRI